jgi:hypothetical protein
MKTIKEIAVENRITSIDLVPVLSNNFDNPMFYKYNNLIVLKNSEKKITIYTNRDVKTINILNVMLEPKVRTSVFGFYVLEGE